jgi:hypothetical protein
MLMVVSLLVLTILQFRLYPYAFRLWLVRAICENAGLLREYGIIISGGVFTSTFVTLIIAIKEYQDARVSILENYYKVSNDFLRNYRNIAYLEISQPFDIVQGCIWEEEENKLKSNFNLQLEESIKKSNGNNREMLKRAYKKLSFEEKSKMLNFIWDNTDAETKERIDNEDMINHYLEEEYKKVMQDYYIKIDEVMKQYIQIRKLDYGAVENAYGQIDFIFSNKKIRKNFIYNCLHDKQRTVLQKIMEEAWHFEEYYKMEQGNMPVMLSKIIDIQKDLFVRREGEVGYTIYNSYCYEIDKQLCELLSITYGKGYEKTTPDIRNYAVFSKIDTKKINRMNGREI